MLGPFLAMLAGAAWGVTAVLARVGLQDLRPSTGTFFSLLSSLAVVVLMTLLLELEALTSVSIAAVLWFAMIGVINFPLARYFNYLGIRRVGASRAAPIVASSPLFAILFAVSFLHENVTLPILLGAVSIVGGLYLLTSGE